MPQKTSFIKLDRVSVIGLLVLIVALLLSSCGPVTPVPVPIIKDPEFAAKYRKAIPKQREALDCLDEAGVFICDSDYGYQLKVSGLPNNEGFVVSPALLPISSADETIMHGLLKDDFKCLALVGNLTFYDNESNIVTSFDAPVTLSISFSKDDLGKFSCIADARAPQNVDEVMPVYLYMPINEASINIWKPFQSFTFNPDNSTFTVEFNTWGDLPIAIGSPK